MTFTINGRFYVQAVTGVQRYARETVCEVDRRLNNRNERARLVVPAMVAQAPSFAAIDTVKVAGTSGHRWEQVVLPFRSELPLLNLCNTAPLAIRRQIVCMHDTNVFDAPASYSFAFRAAYRALLPILARRAMKITSVSQFSARRLAQHIGVDSRLVEVIYNGHEHVFRWNASASKLGGGFSACVRSSCCSAAGRNTKTQRSFCGRPMHSMSSGSISWWPAAPPTSLRI